jgi:phosphoribosylglycinamide formyltransferase 1
MRSIVEACKREAWDAQIVGILSSRPSASGIEYSEKQGIPTIVCDHKAYASRAEFDAALALAVDAWQPSLVLLAGFMRVLSPAFVQHYEGRLLNIHPSLLPSFPGLHTHERALQAGVKLHGATVHFVTAELDIGPIVIQAAVPVREGDTAEVLATRVLEQEHVIYPLAVKWFIDGKLSVDKGKVSVNSVEPQWRFSEK